MLVAQESGLDGLIMKKNKQWSPKARVIYLIE
jgi:hypothetical protein